MYEIFNSPLPRSLSQWRGRRAWLINDFLRKPRITRLGRSREKGKAARLSLPEVVERSVAHCGTQVLRTRFSFVFRGVTGSGDYRPWCATVTRIVVSKIAATHLATWHTLVFPFSTVAGTGNTRGQLVMRVVCCVSGWEREFLFLFFQQREKGIF